MPQNDAMRVKASGKKSLSTIPGPPGSDYSGCDFSSLSIKGQNFFESIFNGCRLTDLYASQSVFQHVEFAETHFCGCAFDDSSFDHSDFVYGHIKNSRFTRCSFQNAEWRDVVFEDVRFEQCIFRNTTASLVQFKSCYFDDASSENFVGSSKRFCVFSNTRFNLPAGQLEFLKLNYGLHAASTRAPIPQNPDALFELSLRRYADDLTSADLYRLVFSVLAVLLDNADAAHKLLLRYLSTICTTCIEEDRLSVFAIQLLHDAIVQETKAITNREDALELLSLVLALRMEMRERILKIEQETTQFPDGNYSQIQISIEFENTYTRDKIDLFLGQMGLYCHFSFSDIQVNRFATGSTIVDFSIMAATSALNVARFVRYYLSAVTMTMTQVRKAKQEYGRITGGPPPKAKSVKVGSKGRQLAKVGTSSRSEHLAQEIMGKPLDQARPIEVFVDTAREQVLVVDGKVRVTIMLS